MENMYCIYGVKLMNPKQCYAPAFKNGQKLMLTHYPVYYSEPLVVTVNNDCEGMFGVINKGIKKVSEAFANRTDCYLEQIIVVDHSVSSVVCCEKYGPDVIIAIPVVEDEDAIYVNPFAKRADER